MSNKDFTFIIMCLINIILLVTLLGLWIYYDPIINTPKIVISIGVLISASYFLYKASEKI